MGNLPEKVVVLLTSLLVGVAGCSGSLVTDPGKRVDVTLSKDAYVSGDTVVSTIRNVSDVTLTYPYGFCKTALQRQQQGGQWTTVSTPPGGCPFALGILGPGGSVPQRYVLAADVQPGVYRLTMPSPIPKGSTVPEPDVTTPPFSVNTVTLSGSM
ncbi:MAG: hypothetical protein ABI194_05335 [Gemmatimonadaceae bacterium]